MITADHDDWMRKANNLSTFLTLLIINVGVLFIDAYIVIKYIIKEV